MTAFLLFRMVSERKIKMKNKKICSKCGGNDIYFVGGDSGAYGVGNNIPLSSIGRAWNNIPVDRYVCGNCGFSEEWIDYKYLTQLKNSKVAHKR